MTSGVTPVTLPIVLFLAAFAGVPFFGGQDRVGPVREVSVLVLADEEVRARPDWRARITASMGTVSGEFERLFGIRLAVRRIADWTSDDAAPSLESLSESLDSGTDRDGCDALLALAGRKDAGDSLLGYSMYKEGIILARFEAGPPGLARVLEHEWGHMFGAAHVADRGSVMNSLLQGGAFDDLNSRIIRLNRDRAFDGIDFPLPKGSLEEAAAIYRDICALNARAKALDRGRDLPPETRGVSVELVGVLDEAGRVDNSSLDDAPSLLAQVYLEKKDYDLAREACRAALGLNPKNLETRNLLGIISRRQGRVDEAIGSYEAILEEKPRSARFLYNLGIARAKKGNLGTAMDLYRQAVEIKPGFAEAWNNIGELELRAGRLEDAEKAFLKAVSLNRSFALAHSNLAEVYVRKKEYGRSRAEVGLALELHADLPGPHNVNGNLLYQQGRAAEAIAEYERALALDPEYEKAYYNLGICLFEAGRIEEASSKFSRAVELAPRFAEAHASLGYALLMLKKTEAGIAEIRLAQELGLVSAKTHLNLSYAHLQKNEAGEAADEARRAIELDPTLAMAYNNLGIALIRNGQVQQAEAAFRKALALDPAYKAAYAGLGSLLSVLGKRDEALGLLLKAANLDPNDGLLQNNIAVLCYRQGAYAEAWAHAQKAMALGVKVDPGFLKQLQEARRRAGSNGLTPAAQRFSYDSMID